MRGLVRLASSVLPAISKAAQCWAELLPQARHVWVDTAEHHAGSPESRDYVALANDRRHIFLDLLLGHDVAQDPGQSPDSARPFLAEFLRAGGEPLTHLAPLRVDVLGLDYYCHSEWYYDEAGARAPSPHPVGFAAVAEQYANRYGLPVMLTETNLRGQPSDQVSWLRYMLEQYEVALDRGVDLHGFCWFPQVDSCDWDSLLARTAGRVDPVGVYAVDPVTLARRRTIFTDAWEKVAAGARSTDLPAFRFQPPCDELLSGVVAKLEHWPWQDPPEVSAAAAIAVDAIAVDATAVNAIALTPETAAASSLTRRSS